MDTLVNWKQSIGVSSKVVTIDSIIANVSGVDTPEKYETFSSQHILQASGVINGFS